MSTTDRLLLVALGSNLGDRLEALRRAWQGLRKMPGCWSWRLSLVVETPPVEVDGTQPPYLNAVAQARSCRDPESLLASLEALEWEQGRRDKGNRLPRRIDLDLLAVGDTVRNGDRLRLPHPGIGRRAFVLVPLGDVAPAWVHPESGRTVPDLLGVLAAADPGQLRGVTPYASRLS